MIMWEYRFLKIIVIPTKSQILMKSHLVGTGYQYFRGHWYDMDFEEAEAPDFSCSSPLANLLSFPWHEWFSGFLQRPLLLSLNACK